MSARAFVITWNELGGLCTHTDPVAIAGKLTSEEADMFFTVIEQWIDFADRLREALDRLDTAADKTPEA